MKWEKHLKQWCSCSLDDKPHPKIITTISLPSKTLTIRTSFGSPKLKLLSCHRFVSYLGHIPRHHSKSGSRTAHKQTEELITFNSCPKYTMMEASSQTFSIFAPDKPSDFKSQSNKWLSVPPVTSANHRYHGNKGVQYFFLVLWYVIWFICFTYVMCLKSAENKSKILEVKMLTNEYTKSQAWSRGQTNVTPKLCNFAPRVHSSPETLD